MYDNNALLDTDKEMKYDALWDVHLHVIWCAFLKAFYRLLQIMWKKDFYLFNNSEKTVLIIGKMFCKTMELFFHTSTYLKIFVCLLHFLHIDFIDLWSIFVFCNIWNVCHNVWALNYKICKSLINIVPKKTSIKGLAGNIKETKIILKKLRNYI